MRLEGPSATIREAVSEEHVDAVVAVTELGSPTVLLFLLATLYWLVDRRRTLLVVSYALAGLTVLITVKAVLGMPRPPESLFLIELDGDEYGFPSGHTFAAVVVYGGLLRAFDRTRSLPAVVGVSGIITLVALSRVVLGLHYLGDVVAGALFGVLALVIFGRLVRGEPRRGFAIAVICSVPALLVTGVTSYTLLGIGGGAGGMFAARYVDRLPALRNRIEGAVLFVVGCTFVLITEVAIDAIPAAGGGVLEAGGGFLEFATLTLMGTLYGLQVAGIILVPAAIGRLEWPFASPTNWNGA
ncbi:phosphatase PAP2 family protein [Natronosalvus amylolyticus]|uniref:phosphatase PAP2 family protein n=1 Tax=Natronosalvus amylolyticus TaxID=2961994 RepID=UPI0020C96C25|nr:phosphatase PAP2 family protein [Natronosalvus amylolyticus]